MMKELKYKEGKMNRAMQVYCDWAGRYVDTFYPIGCKPYSTFTNPFLDEESGEVFVFEYNHDEGGWEEEEAIWVTKEDRDDIEMADIIDFGGIDDIEKYEF